MPGDGRKKALVVGASGVVEQLLAEYLHSYEDWEVVGLSRRETTGGNDVPHITVDLSDRVNTTTKIGDLSDVTHIFYKARFDHEEDQPEPIETKLLMFHNLVETLELVFRKLEDVHIGSVHKNYGLHSGPAPTPARKDATRTTQPSFYYQQEDFIRAQQVGK